MHCELLVPALFPTREPAREALGAQRLPALELLLARGRATQAQKQAPERWLLEAFGGDDSGEDAPLAAGALSVLAEGGEPGEDLWLRADPVHLRLGREAPALIPSDAFEVSREEAEALCEALNVHFAGEPTFYPLAPGRWCARLTEEVLAAAESPLELAGQAIDQRLSAEPAARRWHALLTEIQMVLHPHPVNVERERRGAPALNSLWLWGAGHAPREAAGPWRSVSADEPLAPGPDAVPLPVGTVIETRGRSTLPLGRVAWRHGAVVRPLAVDGSGFAGRLPVRASAHWTLAVETAAGAPLAGAAPELNVVAVPDSAPVVTVAQPGVDTIAPLSLKQPLVIDARDDHGIARVELVSRRVSRLGLTSPPQTDTLPLPAGNSGRLVLQWTLDLNGRGYLPGDTAFYRVRAWDNAPGGQMGETREYRLRLPSNAELREALREAARVQASSSTSFR